MKRREFLKTASAAGVVATLPATWNDNSVIARSLSVTEMADRSKSRDPMKVQKGTLVVNGLDVSVLNDEYIDLTKKGGINCWHKSVGGIDNISDIYNYVDGRDDLTVARTVKQIHEAYTNNKIAMVFGWQAADELAPRMMNMMAGAPKTSLRAYYEIGLRIVGLAYNLTNYFGAGNMEGAVPLSRAGKVLVKEIHKLNMLLDVGGHTGEQTSLDAIALAPDRPVICSHTNIESIADNPRNISDRLIDAIAGTGGVIGLTAVNDFMIRTRHQMDVAHSPRLGVSSLVDQMDYLKSRIGVNHIALGPDFTYGMSINYETINQSLAINREIISDGEWLYVKGYENSSELPNVTAEMIRRGWSTAEIHKILGDNWLRVYEQVWGS